MPFGKPSAYIGVMMLILVLSLITRDSSIAVLALPLLALIFLSSLLQPRNPSVLSITHQLDPERLTGISTVRVELLITNPSENRIRNLEVQDQFSPGLTLTAGTNRVIIDLNPDSSFKLSYAVRPSFRGIHEIGPTRLRVSDPLRLFPSETRLGGTNSLYVYPEERLGRIRINPLRTGSWWGSVPSKRSGAGMDFHGIRDYQPGDEVRSMNWKATARLKRLMTNEYETERASDTVILIDAGRLSGSLIDAKSILDYEVEAGLAVASFLLNGGNRVGLILHGRFRHWLYPAFGRRQYLKLREELMVAKEGDSEIALSFHVSLLAPMILSKGSQVIMIAHPSSVELPKAVVSLQTLGYQMMAILVQPFKLQTTGETPASLAARIMLIEWEENVSEVERLCPTVNWRVDQPLDHTLRRLSLRIRRQIPLVQ